MENNERSSTPYDDVFHSILMCCDDLVVLLINEIFGESYTTKDKVIRKANEHYMGNEKGKEQKVVTDSLLEVMSSVTGICRKYHIECESSAASKTIVIRMFEYDTQIGLDESGATKDNLVVELPHSAVIFLRSSRTDSEDMHIVIRSGGKELIHKVRAIHIRDYTMDELFERKLYFLLPFYIFNKEQELPKIEQDEAKLTSLMALYKDMVNRLGKLAEQGEISTHSFVKLRSMTKFVIDHLATKYENVVKGVDTVMGGQIIETEETRILDEGIAIGKGEGENNLQEVIVLISNGSTDDDIKGKGYSVAVIKKAKDTLAAIGYFKR